MTLPLFDGATYHEATDGKRLNKQLGAVKAVLLTGGWWSLSEIAELTHCPEASISARIRDLRKEAFGGYVVERRRRTTAQYEYRLGEQLGGPL